MIILCLVMFKSVITILLKKNILFCFVKSQVLPSQRQSDSSNMYNVCVCHHKKHWWILTATCLCMDGLGSACSHVAALLFKIEKSIHVRETDDTSSTSILCQWKSTRKSVETLACSYVKNFSSNNPMVGEIPLTKEQLRDLYTINPEAFFFTAIDKIDFLTESEAESSQTDTTSEIELELPELLVSLFDPTAINISI